jgi:hypothetical protein
MGREGTGRRLDRRQACTKERLVWSPYSTFLLGLSRLTANFLDMLLLTVDAAVTLVNDLL